MSRRLPLVDAPILDVPAVVNDARCETRATCIAIVPVREVEPALVFAEHVVRAARVAGARPLVVLTERTDAGSSIEAAQGVARARFVDAGAAHVVLVRSDASHAIDDVRRAVGDSGFVVAVSCDVPAALVPRFTLAITGGRPLTTWTATARAVRSALDAELVEPRPSVARGLVSALDREGLLGPRAE